MKHTQGKLPDDPTRTTSVRKLNGLIRSQHISCETVLKWNCYESRALYFPVPAVAGAAGNGINFEFCCGHLSGNIVVNAADCLGSRTIHKLSHRPFYIDFGYLCNGIDRCGYGHSFFPLRTGDYCDPDPGRGPRDYDVYSFVCLAEPPEGFRSTSINTPGHFSCTDRSVFTEAHAGFYSVHYRDD